MPPDRTALSPDPLGNRREYTHENVITHCFQGHVNEIRRGVQRVLSYTTTMLTVPEAAQRTGRNPETVRRWIREGKLVSRKVGTQHLIDEESLLDLGAAEVVPATTEERTLTGEPMPNFVAALRRSRQSR